VTVVLMQLYTFGIYAVLTDYTVVLLVTSIDLRISFVKHSLLTFTYALENLITVAMQSRQWDSIVFN